MFQEPLQQILTCQPGRNIKMIPPPIGWSSWIKLPAAISPDQAALVNLILILAASAVGGLIIFACCRYYYRGVPISRQLDVSLVPAAMLATLIFYQSGPRPGLSILLIVILAYIHFRTVIQEMDDMIFVFWAVMSGIFIGAGLPLPTLFLDSILSVIGVIIVSRRGTKMVYLLIIRYETGIAGELMPILQPLHGKVRSQYEKNGLIDLTIEVKLRYISLALVDHIASLDGVYNAVMVSNNGNAD